MAIQQDNTTYEYFAFISYKREDEKWAKWLQKKLESYSLPTAIRKKNPELPNKIRPVFRDQSELAGGNLKAEIEKGLSDSKYLIVICSPRSAHSPWVSKEVQHFIDHGKENYIIPFIIGGTPNAKDPKDECFPEGLRQLTGEKEILGININEMGREAAAIKVIAQMFDLRFDSLWQRYKRVKRIKTFSYVLTAVVLLALAVVVSIILWTKNQTIAEQNSQLTLLVENLKEENRTDSRMRNDKGNYSFVGSLFGNESESGIGCIAFHPYEPIVAFTNSWGTWLHYIKSNKEILMPCGRYDEAVTHHVEGLSFSSDGSELIMSSMGGTYIWNVDNCSLIEYISRHNDDLRDSLVNAKFPYFDTDIRELTNLEQLNKRGEYNYTLNDDCLTVSTANSSKSTRLPLYNDERLKILRNPKFKESLFIGPDRAAMFDEEVNEFVQFFKEYFSGFFTYSSNGEYLLIDKDIFSRKINNPDTIKINAFKESGQVIPNVEEVDNRKITNISIRITSSGDFIDYYYYGVKKTIHALTGNAYVGHGYSLSGALLCNSNKIVGIAAQGNHRVFNVLTGEFIGILNNYVWDEDPLGYECCLEKWNSYSIYAKNIRRELYVVSSGGIIRIYNVDKLTLNRIIELPLENCLPRNAIRSHIDKCLISEDGKSIRFKFADYDTVYECSIP